MARSIKLKNENYIDSTGVVHNKKLLSEMLNGFILYNNINGALSNITLKDNIDKYKCVEIFYSQYQGYYDSVKIDLSLSKKATLTASIWLTNQSTYDGFYIDTKEITLNNNQLIVDAYGALILNGFNSNATKEAQNNIRIHKVIGYI